MKRPEKEVVVAELTEAFRNADAVYLTEYRGLTVPQISDCLLYTSDAADE